MVEFLKHGAIRSDGYRFWGYYWNRGRTERRELWYDPERFEEQIEKNRARGRNGNRKTLRRGPEYRAKVRLWKGKGRRAIKAGPPPPKRKEPLTDKRRARNAVRRAVAAGKIVKPGACEKCEEPKPARELHGHHYDGYEDRLKVIWLCVKCHKAAHRQ